MKLSKSKRSSLPSSDFAGPNRSFPINDAKHAKAAIMDSGSAADPGAIKAKAEKFLAGNKVTGSKTWRSGTHKAGCSGTHMGACKT